MAIPSQASASMGYAGWIKIANSDFIRATSCDIRVNQAIEKPEVVDGTIDRTVYKLGPKEIGGSLAFPAVFETNGSTTMMKQLWTSALQRQQSGDFVLANKFKTTVRYSAATAFEYTDCVVDSYEWSVTQSDVVNVKLNIIGIARNDAGVVGNSSYSQPNTRIITWNDVAISLNGEDYDEVRSFTVTVANNVKRYYALNQLLTPVLVTPTKRDISGKISVIGRNPIVGQSADTNDTRCATNQTLGFRLGAGAACKGDFAVEFPELCIFEYEEIAITNDLFETTVNYHVLPGKSLDDSLDTFLI